MIPGGNLAELVARSPLHNAVRIELDPARADEVKTALQALPHVASVEALDGVNGQAALRVLAKAGGPVAVDRGDDAAVSGWSGRHV